MKGPSRFTFEHKWLLEEDFVDFFKSNWSSSLSSNNLSIKLSRCRGALMSCAGNRFDQLGRKIYELRNQLNWLMRSPGIKNNFYCIKVIQCQIEKISDQEEID